MRKLASLLLGLSKRYVKIVPKSVQVGDSSLIHVNPAILLLIEWRTVAT